MELSTITMERQEARQKFLEYRDAVRIRHSAEDAEIMRGYRALSQGMQLVKLSDCISAGGTFESGLPKIAVATASHEWTWCARDTSGAVSFLPRTNWDMSSRMTKDCYRFGNNTLPAGKEPPLPNNRYGSRWNGTLRAMVPIVPPALRPAFSLDGYVTLFEVENWSATPRPPGDPALLKHIGGDLYAVVAIWDLTDLEKAVLTRRNGR